MPPRPASWSSTLEALNHRPMTREEVRRHTIAAGLVDRVLIPADGERIDLGAG